jgi:hypothetical protein
MTKDDCKNKFNNFVNFPRRAFEQAVEKYEVISKPYREQFEAEVNKRLQDGWHLVGGLSASRDGFCQAMTKTVIVETRS